MPAPVPSSSALTVLLVQQPPAVPSPAEMMTMTVELPPGDPGTPPHRHSGPVFGYMLEGEMTFELEGEPERVIGAGEAFWEPGGDVIHYQAANHLHDTWTRFVVVMIGVPGKPMLTLVSEAELEQRRDRRAPAPFWSRRAPDQRYGKRTVMQALITLAGRKHRRAARPGPGQPHRIVPALGSARASGPLAGGCSSRRGIAG